MAHILVVGGAGYIGASTVSILRNAGHIVTVFDNLSTGHRHNLAEDIQCVDGDARDVRTVVDLFNNHIFDVVLDFAAKIQVGESIEQPREYFENNTMGAINIIEEAAKHKVRGFIFSSTAAVYGNPKKNPIEEDDTKQPINPYGVSKYLIEQVLASYEDTHNLNWCALRYFNAAGAHGTIGPDYPFMTHLIPVALKKLLNKDALEVFGSDYNTPDGTCVRDFVHVSDIAQAHLDATEKILAGSSLNQPINLGSNKGNSILEVIESIKNITGQELTYSFAPRRIGDPALLVANNELAQKKLNWKPQKTLQEIIKDAWEWENKNNN